MPTRNRPASLRALLQFLERFYPGTSLIIADGSEEQNKDATGAACEEFSKALTVDYRPYPAEVPVYERLLDVLLSEDDECFGFGADDDFPLIDAYARAEKVLLTSPDCVNVVPADVLFMSRAPGQLTATLSLSRSIGGPTPADRMRDFAWWSFTTTYGVARRSLAIARNRMLGTHNLAGFIDFQTGLEDALHGKIKAVPYFGAIRTQNTVHAHFRPKDRLVFLRKSEQVLAYRDYLQTRLVDIQQLDRQSALKVASDLIARRIAELLGAGAKTRRGFADSKRLANPTLQAQFSSFYDLFEDGTKSRTEYETSSVTQLRR